MSGAGGIPDLVRDSQLATEWHSNLTIHKTTSGGRGIRQRKVEKEEWRREREIARGGFGMVWLEKCIAGGRKDEVRAVKMISKPSKVADSSILREIEAIAKFSQSKVRR